VVNFQPGDSSSANRREPFDGSRVNIEPKMLIPYILPWMVKRNSGLRHRINVAHMRALADITGAAGESPVVFCIGTVVDRWDNMLDLKREVEHGFGRMAILATVSCP